MPKYRKRSCSLPLFVLSSSLSIFVRLETLSSLFRQFSQRLMLFWRAPLLTSCLLTEVSPLSVSLYIFFLLLWVQAHVYLTLPFISILGSLLCDQKKISFQGKRAISQDVQVLRMSKGRRPEGIWMNTRFMSLWDFTLILKGCRDPQSLLVRNNDLPLRSNLKLQRGGFWRCIIPANAQCH